MKMIVSVLLISLITELTHAATLQKVGAFTLTHPAFATLYKDSDSVSPKESFNLIVSTFAGPSLFSSYDSVQLVRRVGMFLNNVNGIVPEVVTKDVTWPNEISAVPGEISRHGLVR